MNTTRTSPYTSISSRVHNLCCSDFVDINVGSIVDAFIAKKLDPGRRGARLREYIITRTIMRRTFCSHTGNRLLVFCRVAAGRWWIGAAARFNWSISWENLDAGGRSGGSSFDARNPPPNSSCGRGRGGRGVRIEGTTLYHHTAGWFLYCGTSPCRGGASELTLHLLHAVYPL